MRDASLVQRGRGSILVVLFAVIAVVVTAMVWGIPWVLFAYPLPGVAVFAAALASMSAIAICVLFAMRHQRTGRRTDLLVASLFGVIALVEGVLPVLAQVEPDTTNFVFWTRVVARTFVALGLCATAWLPERLTRRARFGVIAASSVAITGAAVGWTIAMNSDLPVTVDDATNAGSALLTDPLALAMRLVGMALLLLAAAGFVRKARSLSDPVLDWLACGAVLMGTARVHDFLFPSLHNDWLTSGDVLRLFAEWVILFGLLREVMKLWHRRGTDARAQERRAMAAELHDGLAQELAYLTMQTALAERDPANGERLARVHAAAERALSETRLRIDQYSRKPIGPLAQAISLDSVIAQVSRDVEARYDCRVVLELEEIEVQPRTAHELGRVACEALNNAARHGHPDEIRVRLDVRAGVVRLSIEDDGGGIRESTDATRVSFGLTSMRERAERLGGYCSIVSAPTDGTRVAIEVPQR